MGDWGEELSGDVAVPVVVGGGGGEVVVGVGVGFGVGDGEGFDAQFWCCGCDGGDDGGRNE